MAPIRISFLPSFKGKGGGTRLCHMRHHLLLLVWCAVAASANTDTGPFVRNFEGIPCHGKETFRVAARTSPGPAYGTTTITFTASYFSPSVAFLNEPPPSTASLVFSGNTAFVTPVTCAWTISGVCRLEWTTSIPADVTILGAMLQLAPTSPAACAVFASAN